MTKQDTINTFVIESILIIPIVDIITKLKHDEFRDCDINWLNLKIETFTDIALKTLHKTFPLFSIETSIMNHYTKTKYLHYFNTLLDYFKTYR